MKTKEEIEEFIEATKTVEEFNKFCNNTNGIEYRGEENEIDFPLIRTTLKWVLSQKR